MLLSGGNPNATSPRTLISSNNGRLDLVFFVPSMDEGSVDVDIGLDRLGRAICYEVFFSKKRAIPPPFFFLLFLLVNDTERGHFRRFNLAQFRLMTACAASRSLNALRLSVSKPISKWHFLAVTAHDSLPIPDIVNLLYHHMMVVFANYLLISEVRALFDSQLAS
ncbi:hypothetical protein ZIOFF_045610 [Zingiber officinale]|uniref:Uncharacterized protein n=1 Tax=Zingiber officinale TaxID=94328 RepID=A0A8J5G0S1_ZINOF|nr:hypothetical protein ZIOFF_045610 [Zingiber officinale]